MRVAAAFKARTTHGAPCMRRSKTSMARTSWPFASIPSFSTTWGGLNGARPNVAQARTTHPHESESSQLDRAAAPAVVPL